MIEEKIPKEEYGEIRIKIENGKPPIYALKFTNLNRESVAELISVMESLKLKLIEKYNKYKTSFSKNE